MDDRDRNRDKSLGEYGVEDSIRGKAKHLEGRVKDSVGGLTGDSRLQGEGKVDQLKGKLRDKLGKAERKLDR